METTPEFADGEDRGAPATLGDVLYGGKAKPAAAEKDWAALVRSIANGDQLALHALYERAHRLVFTLSVRITGNRETAEEVTLDVFHDVWRRASAYDPGNGTVLGWIMNQARSRAIDRLRFEQRKKRVDPEATDPLPFANGIDGHEALERKEDGHAVKQALTVLTPNERQAIQAAYFSGLSHAEAAEKLGEPLGTIKTRIRSALQKLRAALTTAKNES